MQISQTDTIDTVIGANLRRLREAERLDLEEVSQLLWIRMRVKMSVSMVSRWETGQVRFTVADLHMWSRFYRVNALGLLTPHDPKPGEGEPTTHIETKNGTVIPVEDYLHQLYIEPRGAFYAQAKSEQKTIPEARSDVDTRTAELTAAAIEDIKERLGAKAQQTDLISAIKRISAHSVSATFPTVTVTTTEETPDAEPEDPQDT
ncbi:helix-turn-helix domain-containing protein [Actinomycetota bacterium]